MDAYATSAIIAFVASLVALLSFYYTGKVKFYAYGVPIVTTCTAFLITADACGQSPQCHTYDDSRVRRMREFIRCRLAYSGVCQDFALWLLYVRVLKKTRQISTKSWCFAYFTLAGLDACIYFANSASVTAQYVTAGVGTVFNVMFFWWVLPSRLWGARFHELFDNSSNDTPAKSRKPPTIKCVVVCVVMFAYIFAVGVVLRDVGPNLSALVSCISPLSFIVVPLCIAIFSRKASDAQNSNKFFRRKMQGVLIAISINNVAFYWALYGFTYVDASLAGYRSPYFWPPLLLVIFGSFTVLFLWCLSQHSTPTSVIKASEVELPTTGQSLQTLLRL